MRANKEEEGTMKKLRNAIVTAVLPNAATAVWIALIIMPAIFTVSNLNITEASVTYVLTLSGGLYVLQHDYMYIIGGGFYPTIYSYTYLITAGWMSISEILIWSLNLMIGITAFRFIQGEDTKKRVYILMILSFLIVAIPSILTIGYAFRNIPLPIFQVFMFFVMKYVRVPTIDDRIKVPFRIRLSSMLSRRKPSQMEREVHKDIEEHGHNDDL